MSTSEMPSSHNPQTVDIHQLAAKKLAVAGQRYTTTRRTIVDALHLGSGPLTIAGILEFSERLAQSSTYRNLVLLEEAAVVQKIVVSDDFARFELTEDVTGYHHHHLICEDCGEIIDVHLAAELEQQLEAALAEQARRIGFKESHHRIDLVGCCAKCNETAPKTG